MAQASRLHAELEGGDVVLADRGFCSYAHLVLLVEAGNPVKPSFLIEVTPVELLVPKYGGNKVMDVYSRDGTKDITDAIEDCCLANDLFGFSGAAISCFWNPSTREILYLGLSRVIALRFMQRIRRM